MCSALNAYGKPIRNLPQIPFTTLHRLKFREALELLSGEKLLLWLVSRLEDEYVENLVEDHYHPEIAAPLQGLVRALVERMEAEGLSYVWLSGRNYLPTPRGRE